MHESEILNRINDLHSELVNVDSQIRNLEDMREEIFKRIDELNEMMDGHKN